MLNLSYRSIQNRFVWPIIVQIILSLIIIITISVFHNYKSRLNDSILIAKRQSMILDVIDNSVQSAYEGNRDGLQKLESYMKMYHSSLLSLQHGGSVDYTKDRVQLPRLRDEAALAILKVIQDTYKHYETNLGTVVHHFNNKERIRAAHKTILVNEYHSDLHDLNDQLVDRFLTIKNDMKLVMTAILIAMIAGMLLTIFVLVNGYVRFFKRPITRILDVTTKTGKGNIRERIDYQSKDELGQIAEAIDSVIDNQQNVVKVLEKIGEGDFNIYFQKSSERDILGNSVEVMRNQLQNFFEEDKRKSQISNWTNQGVAKFAEILRNNNNDITELAEKISSELTKYVEANQGAVYVLEESNDPDVKRYLVLLATYAWKRKKFLEKNIEIGEGLVGQCILERDTIFLTEVPDNYIEITSGLGKSNPNCILIVPIKVNDEIYGVIELASFNVFEPHAISLVEKVAESIASSISAVRTNEHTRKLLEESQLLTEQMRAQEEELRQNAEELQATQESIEQKLELLDFEKKKNSAILETCVDGCISFNQYGKVEIFNKSAEEIWKRDASHVIGGNINDLMPLHISREGDNHVVYFVVDDNKIPIGVRTEVNISDATGEEQAVLLTINEAKIGEEHFFTVFAQSISVELF